MKHYSRILAALLMLAMLVSMLSFPVAAAEEEEQDTLCKVLVWTDANGEHAVPYTDLSGWDRVWADSIGTNEYLLYDAGFGTYREYFSAGFASRYMASEPEGVVGLALVKIGDVVNGTTPNTYEMKIDATINFSWKAGIAGPSTFYPVKGVIFYDPNSTSDEPVEASIDPSALSSRWYGAYPPACHLSGADGAALAEALANGIVSLKVRVGEHTYQGGACTACGKEAPACHHDGGVDPTTGICADCGKMSAVASVTLDGTTSYYHPFQAALDAWVDGSTLTLLADVTYNAGDIEILNKSVILDLNGKRLSLDPNSLENILVGDMELVLKDENGNFLDEPVFIPIPGELTIRDTQGGGSLDAYHLSVVVCGTFRLEGGTLEKAVSVDETGTVYMTGGKIIGQNANSMGQAIDLYGTLNISGGEVTGRYGIWTYSGSSVNISGSPIITGTDRDERVFGAALRSGKDASVTVSGTPVFTGGRHGVFSVNNPIVFNTQPADGTWSVHISTDDITANAGVFAIPGEGMDLDPAKFVSLVENYYVAKNDDGALYLAECDHTAEIAVYNGDGTHDVTCPCGSVLIQDNVSCSGGEDSCVSGAVCQVCGGEYGQRKDHTFNPATGNCLVCDEPMAEASLTIARLTTYYQSVQAAANAGFNSRHTVTLCKDVDLSDYLTIHEGCTLDLAGWTLSSDSYMALYVSGSAVLTDSSGTGSIKAKGSPAWGVWVQSDLVMAADLPIVAAEQAFYYNSGLLDLTALTSPSSYNVCVANDTPNIYDHILLPAGYIFYSQNVAVPRGQTVASGTELTINVCYAHTDADLDHVCDLCLQESSQCADENADGKCDICGELMGVIRLAGANRYATAIMAADEMKAALNVEKFDAIIIASGNDFADALAGSYLATVKNAPILLSYGGTSQKYAYLDTDNIDYVKANLAEGGTVYILGGKNAVPELYEAGLEGYQVKRLGGANRFETNILILKEAGITAGSEVLVCTSNNFADSLSASATGLPILLVWNERGILYGNQPEFLAELEEKNCKFTILGGESAVSAKLEDTIKTYGDVTRLAGKNRMETSVLVAQKYFDAPETAVVAYAWNYPDGLCGGSLAFALKAPLILTMPNYEKAAVDYAAENGITVGFVLGGEKLVTDEIVRAIFAMDAEDEIIVK